MIEGYLARVELHEIDVGGSKRKPDEKIYNSLHLAMLKLGFSRTISFGEVIYELPHATYDKTSIEPNQTPSSVLEMVTKVAKSIWPLAGVIVVGYANNDYKQSGLRRAPSSLIDFENQNRV